MFATIVAAFTQIAGLEVNQVIARQLHILPDHDQRRLLKLHAYISITLYYSLIPLIVLFYRDLLNAYWAVGAFILVMEHYATELFRYYIVKLKPITATSIVFFKNAGWVIVFMSLRELDFINSSLSTVLNCWAISLLAILLCTGTLASGISILSKYTELKTWTREAVNLVKQARFFIGSATAVAGIGAVDKIIISEAMSLETLGSYFFYQTLSLIPAMIVNFSLGATIWPRCVQLSALGQLAKFSLAWRRMRLYYILILFASSVFVATVAPLTLGFVGKESFLESFDILYILLFSSAMYTLCDPYKLKMYTEKKDSAILVGSSAHLLLNIAFGITFALLGEVMILAIGLLFANLISLAIYHFRVPVLIVGFFQR